MITDTRHLQPLVNVLTAAGFTQGWWHGGPPFPPKRLTDDHALGLERLAWFDHAASDLGVKLDLETQIFHVVQPGRFVVARGAGAGQLRRALRAALSVRSS